MIAAEVVHTYSLDLSIFTPWSDDPEITVLGFYAGLATLVWFHGL